MIRLTELSGKFGAPMGRTEENWQQLAEADAIAIEWMPIDGGYDVGGAYWGSGESIYCIVGFVNDEEVSRSYARAGSREEAWEDLCLENRALLPETGSIVEQTIEFLQNYKAGLSINDEQVVEELNAEISDLEDWLEERGLT